jgi:8-oxo-dGTP pyrophosphatase MutT (NUDIX family)
MSRDKLPYRKEVSVFLIDKNKVMAKDSKTFMIFPGGGVDPGESLEKALRREVVEETGAIINTNLKLVAEVKSEFYPEWANISEKRKKRYKQFKGGHIYIFVGTVKEFVKPTSEEGDAWTGYSKRWFLPITKVIKMTENQEKKQHPNDRAFRATQKAILSTILYQRKHKI